ncbi:MAG: peptidylprolyl isomerase [Dehalococcoidia bacterium]|nr:peptidylprolyl isomerase [Dehalococcoidia bacterium]
MDETSTPAPTGTVEGEDPITRSYEAAPEMSIDVARSYEAVIHLDAGDVRVELLPDEAPGYVNNFVFLAQNDFFDGLTFHRVVPGFVAQGGDPTGSGFGGPGYGLEEESNRLTFEPGVLSMAKSAAGVSGSQFFVTLGPAPHLNGDFTVFGRVTEGLELLEALGARNPETAEESGVVIQDIEIIEGGQS